jgi:hypothetical protein
MTDPYMILLCAEVQRLRDMPPHDKVCSLLERLIVLHTLIAHPERFDDENTYGELVIKAQSGESCAIADGYPPHLLKFVTELPEFDIPSNLVLVYLQTHPKNFDLNFVFLLAAQAVTDHLISLFEKTRTLDVPYPTSALDLSFLLNAFEDTITLTDEAKSNHDKIKHLYHLTLNDSYP